MTTPSKHQCDSVPAGGLVTYSRFGRVVRATMAGQLLPTEVVDELGACATCWITLTSTLARAVAHAFSEKYDDALMTLEIDLGSVEARLARGETELPPEGFSGQQ